MCFSILEILELLASEEYKLKQKAIFKFKEAVHLFMMRILPFGEKFPEQIIQK